ncbi:MAG: hypothetical protein LUG26_07670 [Ruminococcus sp.]|nr:hypothetical protein [Ruminococcus sp.]
MATRKKTAETEVTTTSAQETAQPKFTVERLAVDCRRLFDVSSCTYAGATHGMTGEYTVEEMKAHIKKWCGTEVK